MADGVFNVAKGRVNEYVERIEQDDPTGCELVLVLLKVTEADATLIDYDTLAALLAGSNSEADFTNYAQKVMVAANVARAVDDTNNWQTSDFDDQTWTAAGGTTDNSLVKAIVCYDPLGTGVAANMVPLTHHDFSATTNGSDLAANVNASGFYKAV